MSTYVTARAQGVISRNIWWSVPQFAPRIVRVLSILSRHLAMMKSGIRPSGLVCILLFEHGVDHYQIKLSAVPIEAHYWNYISRSHNFPKAEDHLSFSLAIPTTKYPVRRYWGCFGVYPLADCKMPHCYPSYCKAYSRFSLLTVWLAIPIVGILHIVWTTRRMKTCFT